MWELSTQRKFWERFIRFSWLKYRDSQFEFSRQKSETLNLNFHAKNVFGFPKKILFLQHNSLGIGIWCRNAGLLSLLFFPALAVIGVKGVWKCYLHTYVWFERQFSKDTPTFIFKGAWRRGSVMKQVFRMTLEVSSSLGRSESQLNFSFKGFAPGTFNFSMSRG